MNINFNQIVNNMLEKNPAFKQNPVMQNALQMAQRGDEKGLQQLAQNVANSKGIDINKIRQDILKQFGM